ncbi:endonuclease/exonuclease/phosphatase family protein [Algibacter sp.]|nr:endonuclease/exonuclease/phosphatase family protein [Algibacter sp.]
MIIWLGRSFKIHFPENIVASDLEIVFWNGARGNDFRMAFEENDGIPDVMVLSEINDEDIIGLRDEYSGLYFYKNQRELMIFSQTPLSIKLDTVSSFSTSVVYFETANTEFYAVDVSGSTDVPRAWELGFVNSIIKKQTNTIILGDFNVPFESKFLDSIKNNFNHAFNEKGNGFRETWFWNIPLLSLDHIWVSKDLKVLKTEKIGTFKSDHNMLKTFIKKTE